MNATQVKKCNSCGTTYDSAFSHCPHDGERLILADSLIGVVLDGRYRIDGLIGHGGMGVVYRATHIFIDNEFALKVLRPDLVLNNAAIERFKREARAAGRIRHPNAIQVTDFGVTREGIVYLVMELVEGKSLRELIDTEGRFHFQRAAAIMQQACAALQAAHDSGVIHRDLKPDNIVVMREAAIEKVKVLDFGLAKLRERSSPPLRGITEVGTIVGTPQYMSPEQCQERELDGRSDIYTLGIILYEMLSGRPPFGGESSLAIVIKQLNEAPVPLCQLAPSVPENFGRVVMRAIEKVPAKRQSSARELAHELQEVLRATRSQYETNQMVSPAASHEDVARRREATPQLGAEPLLPRHTSVPSGPAEERLVGRSPSSSSAEGLSDQAASRTPESLAALPTDHLSGIRASGSGAESDQESVPPSLEPTAVLSPSEAERLFGSRPGVPTPTLEYIDATSLRESVASIGAEVASPIEATPAVRGETASVAQPATEVPAGLPDSSPVALEESAPIVVTGAVAAEIPTTMALPEQEAFSEADQRIASGETAVSPTAELYLTPDQRTAAMPETREETSISPGLIPDVPLWEEPASIEEQVGPTSSCGELAVPLAPQQATAVSYEGSLPVPLAEPVETAPQPSVSFALLGDSAPLSETPVETEPETTAQVSEVARASLSEEEFSVVLEPRGKKAKRRARKQKERIPTETSPQVAIPTVVTAPIQEAALVAEEALTELTSLVESRKEGTAAAITISQAPLDLAETRLQRRPDPIQPGFLPAPTAVASSLETAVAPPPAQLGDAITLQPEVSRPKTTLIAVAVSVAIAAIAIALYVVLRAHQAPNTIQPPHPVGEMVFIQGGTFTMGRNDGDPDERPAHLEGVKSFYLDKYEVTNEQYKAFVDATGHPAPENWENGSYPPGKAKFPVTYVTWQDAVDYARWARKRLPTEAEWEYAARGGGKGYLYPWGNRWIRGASNVAHKIGREPANVGSFPRDQSAFGIFDLAGNVSEWVQDQYRTSYGGPPDQKCLDCMVFRGSNIIDAEKPNTWRWSSHATIPREESRKEDYSVNVFMKVGFRCARDSDK